MCLPLSLSLCVCVFRWIQALECVGGRNTLAALRRALEEEPQEEAALTHGVYLLTTGMPDQHMVSRTFMVLFNHTQANSCPVLCTACGFEVYPADKYVIRTFC